MSEPEIGLTIPGDESRLKMAQRSREFNEKSDDPVESLLAAAIDVDQSIAASAALLQSPSPTERTALGSLPDPRVDLEARKIEAKAMKHGQIIRQVRQELKRRQSARRGL